MTVGCSVRHHIGHYEFFGCVEGKSSAGLFMVMSFTSLARLAVDACLKLSNTLLT